MKYTIYCDGICEPTNPGKGAWAFVVFNDQDSEIVANYDYAGTNRTNNEMEYLAVIEALVWCHEMDGDEFEILTDSQLVVKQLNGEWQVKSDKLRSWFDNAFDLMQPNVKIGWVSGIENRADELTRVAYEKGTGLWPMPRKKGEWKVNLVSRKLPNVVNYEKVPF